ncbi:hypothetical protein BK140_17735 [Paenibacillus macerans]|nr:hypothetical protein BK140_17735 [Paenibacillus macerans]
MARNIGRSISAVRTLCTIIPLDLKGGMGQDTGKNERTVISPQPLPLNKRDNRAKQHSMQGYHFVKIGCIPLSGAVYFFLWKYRLIL